MKRALALCACVAALAGCASAPPRDPTLGPEWMLVGEGENRPTIFFDEDRAAGFAGCNRFFATARREGSGLSLSHIGVTRMYCEGRMEAEQDYIARLGQVASARRDEDDDDELLLLDAQGRVLLHYARDD